MSVDALAELRDRWFPEQGSSPLQESLDRALDVVGFTREYIVRVASGPQSVLRTAKTKVVKDNVWGMVELDGATQLLVDCPVVQRLRRIKQLGLTYLTYPSAEHTRFAHSLGMYCVIYNFINSVRRIQNDAILAGKKAYGYDHWPLTVDLSADLLHAAILHDIGHMPFSHASERTATQNALEFHVGPKTVEEFMLDAEEVLRKNLKLAELLSLVVILSPRFATFYSDIVRNRDPQAVLRVASLIAGLPPKVNERGAAELISGTAIDADKIDYINRDAQACGIPVGIDVARLFLRSAFLKVSSRKLEQLTSERGLPADSMVLIVNSSGVNTIEELAQARTSLYQRVYLHQLTMCAEAVLDRGLRSLADGNADIRNVLSLWTMSDNGVISALISGQTEIARTCGDSIRTRVLPKKALVISKRVVCPRINIACFLKKLPNHVSLQLFKLTVGPILEQLRFDQPDFAHDVLVESTVLVNRVRQLRADLIPRGNPLNNVLFLPSREIAGQRKDCLIIENGELMFSSARHIADEQSDALEISKAQAFVVGSVEWREFNSIAAAVVLSRLTGKVEDYDFRPSLADPAKRITVKSMPGVLVELTSSAGRAGVDIDRLRTISVTAAKAGYFDTSPRLFPYEPDCADNIEIEERLNRFDGEGTWTVTRRSVAAFVTQFPPTLRPSLVALLKRVDLLARDVIAGRIMAVVEEISTGVPGHVVVTGFSPDSGTLTRMLFEQELKTANCGQGLVYRKEYPGRH